MILVFHIDIRLYFFSVEKHEIIMGQDSKKKALKIYSGHRQEYGLAVDAKSGFSSQILLKQ